MNAPAPGSVSMPPGLRKLDPAVLRTAIAIAKYKATHGLLPEQQGPPQAPDPCALMSAMGMEPDEWQVRLLRSESDRILLNIHRQAGKSTVVGALAVHTALYTPQSLVLLLSPALRQSGELFRKCLQAYRAMGQPVPAEVESALTLELANGSRIVSLPGKEETIRGYSGVRLLVVDEASRVGDDLYKSVRPMLAVSGGRLIAPSTPFGKRGWWHDAWFSDSENWERYEVPATQCSRISPAFLAEEEQALGSTYAQEYLNAFLETAGSVFRYEDIERLNEGGTDLEPLFSIESEVA